VIGLIMRRTDAHIPAPALGAPNVNNYVLFQFDVFVLANSEKFII
jgi:hypothetical protein